MYIEIVLDISLMVYVYEKEFLNYVNFEEVYDKFYKVVKVMVGCVLEIYLEDGLFDEIKKNYLN